MSAVEEEQFDHLIIFRGNQYPLFFFYMHPKYSMFVQYLIDIEALASSPGPNMTTRA